MPNIDSGVLTQLREHYTSDITEIIFDATENVTPLFAMCESKGIRDGFGRQFVAPIVTNEGAAVAADPEVADEIAGDGAAGGRPTRDRWVITRVSMDSTFVFTRDEILAIEGKGADEQFDVMADEMDKAVVRIRNMLAEQVSGDGWGALAQITAISSSTITVSPKVANRFRKGWRLVASNTKDTDVTYNSGASLRVTGVNTSTGVITLSGDPTSAWSNDSNLYVFRYGNRIDTDPGSDASLKLCISGLSAAVDPDSTTFWGITRTADPDLTGHGVDCTGLDTVEALEELAERAFYQGKKMDTILVPGVNWKLLNLDKDASKTVQVALGDYQIGFKAFNLPTAYGMVAILPDAFMEPGACYGGPFRDKKLAPKLYHAGDKLINLDAFDGKDFERQTANGAREFKGQFFFSGQFVLEAPGAYFKGTTLTTS